MSFLKRESGSALISRFVQGVLWFFFTMSLLEELSTMEAVLDRMRVSGRKLPLQSLLSQFSWLWEVVDSFWRTFLGSYLFGLLFRDFVWGGFTSAALFWALAKYLSRRDDDPVELNRDQEVGRRLCGLYVLVFVAANVYGVGKDNWVPYVQDQNWEINVAHKQQVSGGSFMILFFVVWCLAAFPHVRGHNGALRLLASPRLLTYVFVVMFAENLASYSWFPHGYAEIFAHHQSWTSPDKLFHFFMSSAVTVVIIMFAGEGRKAISVAMGLVIFWELFEVVLHPNEASDSVLDMVINGSAIVVTYWISRRLRISPMPSQTAGGTEDETSRG